MNKQEQAIKYVRWIFSVILAYLVYRETGPFTAVATFLTFITFEIICVWIKETTKLLKKLAYRP